MNWCAREILAPDVAVSTWLSSAREAALADQSRAQAFGITPENVDEVLHKRSHFI